MRLLSAAPRLAVLALLSALPACVAQGAPGAVAQGGAARQGARSVTLDGAVFAADIAADAPGVRLTAQGAVPVPGLVVRVSRAAPPLAGHEGAVAKRVARMACTDGGGTFREQAIGTYAAPGLWSFRGGCA